MVFFKQVFGEGRSCGVVVEKGLNMVTDSDSKRALAFTYLNCGAIPATKEVNTSF